jgi:ADP-glucose pyrophosphorylase
VLGEGTVIGNNCNLNECYTGKGVRVSDGSKLKSETLSADDGTKDGDSDGGLNEGEYDEGDEEEA